MVGSTVHCAMLGYIWEHYGRVKGTLCYDRVYVVTLWYGKWYIGTEVYEGRTLKVYKAWRFVVRGV